MLFKGYDCTFMTQIKKALNKKAYFHFLSTVLLLDETKKVDLATITPEEILTHNE